MKTTIRRPLCGRQKLGTLFVALLSALALCSPSVAQTVHYDAHLSGTLLDPSGAAVANVQITAQLDGVPTADLWTVTSSTDGTYELALPAGRYHVQFVRPPFVSLDFVLEFTPEQRRTLDLRLRLERLSSSVIVSGQALPTPLQDTAAPVTVITRKEIDARQSIALMDALEFTPGIAVGRNGPNGGTSSIFLDGGNSNFVKVLVDGTPINPPGGAVDFSIFTLDNIDKVEVVRGAESALYGTDAVSGVIQVFTHRGTSHIPIVSVFGEGGSYSTARFGEQISGLFGAFDYSLAGAFSRTDGQGPNNDFQNHTLSGNFGYTFSDTNLLRFTLRDNSSDAGIPGQTLFLPPSLHQRYDQQLSSANFRWDFSTGTHWQNEVSAGDSYTRQHSSNPTQSFYATNPRAFCPQDPRAIPPPVATTNFCDYTYDSRQTYNTSNLNAQTSYLLPKFGVTAGYQYEVENGSISYLQATHVRRNNQGGFLDFRYLPISRVSINFGLRAEANYNFGTRVVPRLGASLALHLGTGFWGDTRYRIFYGQGIKEPRFDQSYGTDPCDPGNSSLKPEASKTFNTGIEQKLASDHVKISADFYANRFYDIVSFAFCLPDSPCSFPPITGCPFGFGSYFNTDLARARGTDIAVEAQALRWLTLAGTYSYDNSRVLVSPNATDPALVPGNRLLRRPPQSGSLTINAAYRQFSMTLGGYFTGSRTDSDFLFLGHTRNPGYARIDLAARYHVNRGLSIYARATNLFDKSYQDVLGYPALGRDLRIGMSYLFGGQD